MLVRPKPPRDEPVRFVRVLGAAFGAAVVSAGFTSSPSSGSSSAGAGLANTATATTAKSHPIHFVIVVAPRGP